MVENIEKSFGYFNRVIRFYSKSAVTRLGLVAAVAIIVCGGLYSLMDALTVMYDEEQLLHFKQDQLGDEIIAINDTANYLKACTSIPATEKLKKANLCKFSISKFDALTKTVTINGKLSSELRWIHDNKSLLGMEQHLKKLLSKKELELRIAKRPQSLTTLFFHLSSSKIIGAIATMIVTFFIGYVTISFVFIAREELPEEESDCGDKKEKHASKGNEVAETGKHDCVFCTTENSNKAKSIQIISLLVIWISIATVATVLNIPSYIAMVFGFAVCIFNQRLGRWLSLKFGNTISQANEH